MTQPDSAIPETTTLRVEGYPEIEMTAVLDGNRWRVASELELRLIDALCRAKAESARGSEQCWRTRNGTWTLVRPADGCLYATPEGQPGVEHG